MSLNASLRNQDVSFSERSQKVPLDLSGCKARIAIMPFRLALSILIVLKTNIRIDELSDFWYNEERLNFWLLNAMSITTLYICTLNNESQN